MLATWSMKKTEENGKMQKNREEQRRGRKIVEEEKDRKALEFVISFD
jgi:hypothetical protein